MGDVILLCRLVNKTIAMAVMAITLLVLPAQLRAADALSGTLVIVTSFPQSLFEKFSSEFEQRHPGVKVFVRSKKTSAAISFIEERVNEPVDLFWASAPDAFEVLKEAGQLQSTLNHRAASKTRIGSYPIDDPEGYYRGFAISGYGIVWNHDYVKANGLSAPRQWRDLTNSDYARHIGISAPSRSGTTHLIVESILQAQGWEQGWATLMEIGGNLATVTARSFGVIDGILAERFGVGAAIDFLGLSAKASGSPVDFIYPEGTAFLPANIALVKRSHNPQAALAFMDFVLSEAGQTLLFDPAISRLPVMSDVYVQAPQGYANPFSDELMNKGIAFDADLSRQRYHMVNSLFDVMITFRQQALRSTWKAIHEAEALLDNQDEQKHRQHIEEAKAFARSVPVLASEAAATTLPSIFVRHKPGISVPFRQTKIEAQWATFARQNQERAFNLANGVLADLKARP